MSTQTLTFDALGAKPPTVAASVDAIVGGFGAKKFVESFEVLAEAAKGIEAIRRLVLDLAVQGRLTSAHAECSSRVGDELLPFSPPSGWTWVQLGKVTVRCDYGTSQKAHLEPRGVAVLRMNNIQAGRLDTSSLKYVPSTTEGLPDLLLAPGDLLFNRTNSFELVGKMAVFREAAEYTFASYLIRLRLQPEVQPEYVNFYFGSSICRQTQIEPHITKQTNQANFNGSKLKEVLLPLPPRAEQKRIVAKVDQLMRLLDDLEAKQAKKRETQARLRTAALDALTSAEGREEFEAAWKRVAENLWALFERAESIQPLRTFILEMAFLGRLVGPAVGDDDPSDAVFRIDDAWKLRRRKEIFGDVPLNEIPASPARWTWVRLGNLAEVVGGVTKGRDLHGRTVRSYPYLRVANVQRGFLDLEQMKNIEIPAEELPKYRLAPGDILFTEGGDWDKLGRSSVWHGEIDPCIHQNHVFRARLVLDELDPAWFSLFANSPLGRRYFENAAKQTTNLASINMTQLKNCPMPLPPLAEKRRIIARVDQLMKLCDDLEAKLRRSEETAAKFVEAVVREMVAA